MKRITLKKNVREMRVHTRGTLPPRPAGSLRFLTARPSLKASRQGRTTSTAQRTPGSSVRCRRKDQRRTPSGAKPRAMVGTRLEPPNCGYERLGSQPAVTRRTIGQGLPAAAVERGPSPGDSKTRRAGAGHPPSKGPHQRPCSRRDGRAGLRAGNRRGSEEFVDVHYPTSLS